MPNHYGTHNDNSIKEANRSNSRRENTRKNAKKLGRPVDKGAQERYLQALRKGHSPHLAARVALSDPQRLQDWRKNEEFRLAEMRAQIDWNRRALRAVERGLATLDPDQAVAAGSLGLKVLERRDPGWAPPKERHEHTGADGAPLVVEVAWKPKPKDEGEAS